MQVRILVTLNLSALILLLFIFAMPFIFLHLFIFLYVLHNIYFQFISSTLKLYVPTSREYGES